MAYGGIEQKGTGSSSVYGYVKNEGLVNYGVRNRTNALLALRLFLHFEPLTRYGLKKKLDHISHTTCHALVGELEKLGLIRVVLEKTYRTGLKMKEYDITENGVLVMFGFASYPPEYRKFDDKMVNFLREKKLFTSLIGILESFHVLECPKTLDALLTNGGSLFYLTEVRWKKILSYLFLRALLSDEVSEPEFLGEIPGDFGDFDEEIMIEIKFLLSHNEWAPIETRARMRELIEAFKKNVEEFENAEKILLTRL